MSAEEVAQLREAVNRKKEAQLHAGKQNLGTGSLFGRPTALQLLGALSGDCDKDEGDGDREDEPIDPSDPHTVPDGDADDDEETSSVSTLFLPPNDNNWQKSFMGGGVMNNGKLKTIPGMQPQQKKITSRSPEASHVVGTIGSVSFFNKREQTLTPKLDLLVMSDGGHVVKTEEGDHMPYNAWLESERARQRQPPPDTGNERWDAWKDAPGFRKFQDLVAATQLEDEAQEVDEEDPPPPYHEEAEEEAPPAYNNDEDGHDGDDDEGDEGDHGQAEFV